MSGSGNRIQWLSDLIRLEVSLWNHINARLQEKHALSLAFFEVLYAIGQTEDGSLRVGDIARALSITVGAASKLADRVAAAGLIRRELDSEDRRASRLVLTEVGHRELDQASATYATALTATLDKTLTQTEQRVLHDLVKRLLVSSSQVGDA